MKLNEHLQKLDDLIVEHIRPPVQTEMRNHLHLALEQSEAQTRDLEHLTKLCEQKDDMIAKQKTQIDQFIAISKIKRPSTVPPMPPNII